MKGKDERRGCMGGMEERGGGCCRRRMKEGGIVSMAGLINEERMR